MQTLTRKPKQFTLTLAVAVLAIGAMVAVALMAGGTTAQATSASLTPDVNEDGSAQRPLATSHHATPEPCPGEIGNDNTLETVVSSGHIALFDVYWNPDEKELTNSPCPPTVVHVPEEDDGLGTITPARDDRTASNINIDETIIHIPDSAKVTLSETNYPVGKYKELWDADNAENPNGDGDGMVWMVPACPPDGSPGADELCLAFSAALLNPLDWSDPDTGEPANATVQYLIDHVHQIDIDEQDPRYVLVFDVPDETTEAPYKAVWDTSNADQNVMTVAPGQYERPMWFFTSPGTFEFQVHIKGHPYTKATDPVSHDVAVTSDVREYTFHVGPMADLGVEVSAAEASTGEAPLEPNDQVTITVTAKNAGPDTATSTMVDVNLPEGLMYSSHTTGTTDTIDCPGANEGDPTTQETYCPDTGVWAVGDLLNGNTETLTITATVKTGTRGQELTITSDIYATEHIGSFDVVELDPRLDDNTDVVSVTPVAIPNVDPLFMVNRSVVENSAEGTNVGDPVLVKEPDAADRPHLVFELEGDGADQFDVEWANGGAQISVRAGATIDYDSTTSYDLVLTVRDSKDGAGNTDASVDNRIAVYMDVTEDYLDDVTLTLTSEHTGDGDNEQVTLTTSFDNTLPSDHGDIAYVWEYRLADTAARTNNSWSEVLNETNSTLVITKGFAEGLNLHIRVTAFVLDSDGNDHEIGPVATTVNWQS